ncbi:sensor histidine kinase [Pseudobacteriovorax antillogorgiicola]|uniref:histidine kinase n=1 Tax=Pseudobacteriovorax antillogorgiicola TaxID=1513793 RepID=A0A1Y6C462_9BACT|nr:HAMP domain-containing sensor histidine kinase [Pseudobacteriovorax antillogorgiicola]TCS51274.1 signal transduction histidine kinase [Pseudobacteriovorax antillogorgiicola]SMF36331.1 Signal transduction histidine kinase [Pseudobacteriovorax antillogorgiicola]
MNPLRIIIIDDTEDIHNNIKILFQSQSSQDALDKLSEEIFGAGSAPSRQQSELEIAIDSAYQGQEGYEMIKQAVKEGNPYAVAVVDMRMPPGWDGLMTIEKIRDVDQDIEIIISSAYSDYSWQDIADRLGVSNKYLFLSKPFEVAEMKQMIVALTQKWTLDQENRSYIRKLKEANEEVQAAIRAKDDFLGVMSHELRTPLNIIIMTLEDILEAESDPDTARILQNSEDSAKYLARLIDNIMYFIHLDSHNFRFEETQFSMDDLVQEVMDECQVENHRDRLQFDVELDSSLPEVTLDRKRMRIALHQLVDNAIKFTDEGQVRIRIRPQSSGTSLFVEVEDTGIGMGPMEQKQAFDLFYQGEATNHHSRTGTGVGLSLCRKIVRSLGGEIGCKSQEAIGSTFWFEIPLKSVPENKVPEKKLA